jgi:hypothetical protein
MSRGRLAGVDDGTCSSERKRDLQRDLRCQGRLRVLNGPLRAGALSFER